MFLKRHSLSLVTIGALNYVLMLHFIKPLDAFSTPRSYSLLPFLFLPVLLSAGKLKKEGVTLDYRSAYITLVLCIVVYQVVTYFYP